MSKKDETLKLALEALESYHGYMEPLTTVFGGPRIPAEQSTTGKVERAITAIREALAEQPAQQQEQTDSYRDAQEAPFEAWWEKHGQFLRAGGGQYEKTFAWHAWCEAAKSPPPQHQMTFNHRNRKETEMNESDQQQHTSTPTHSWGVITEVEGGFNGDQQHPDDQAVDRFTTAMKDKLAKAREKGRCGWETCSPDDLSRMLREHVEKGDPRDVANFCMMLWNLGAGIAAQQQELCPSCRNGDIYACTCTFKPAQQQEPITGETNVELGFYTNDASNGQQRKLDSAVEVGQLVGDRTNESASNLDPEGAIAVITGIDEYGPMLGWYEHWINYPVGTKFYTSPPASKPWVGLTDRENAVTQFALHRFMADAYAQMTAAAQDKDNRYFKPGAVDAFAKDAKDAESLLSKLKEKNT